MAWKIEHKGNHYTGYAKAGQRIIVGTSRIWEFDPFPLGYNLNEWAITLVANPADNTKYAANIANFTLATNKISLRFTGTVKTKTKDISEIRDGQSVDSMKILWPGYSFNAKNLILGSTGEKIDGFSTYKFEVFGASGTGYTGDMELFMLVCPPVEWMQMRGSVNYLESFNK